MGGWLEEEGTFGMIKVLYILIVADGYTEVHIFKTSDKKSAFYCIYSVPLYN